MKNKLHTQFDDPHNIRAFNTPLEYDREEIPLPEQQAMDLLTKMQQPSTETPRQETDVNALEDRKSKFERFMASLPKENEAPEGESADRDVYDERDRNRGAAMFLKGAQQTLGGATNRYNSDYKQDTSVPDQLYKDANTPILDQDRDIKIARDSDKDDRDVEQHESLMDKYVNMIEKDDISIIDLKQTRDPASQISKIAQDLTIKTNPDMNPNDISSMSAYELNQMVPQVQMLAETVANKQKAAMDKRKMGQTDRGLDIQEDEIAARQVIAEAKAAKDKENQGIKATKEERLNGQTLVRSVTALKNDEDFKAVLKQNRGFNEAKSLIDEMKTSKNEAALAALGTKLARAMGEVGVLTDADVQRYVGSASWGRKVNDWWSKGAKGELPKETLDDLVRNIDIIEKTLQKDMTQSIDSVNNRLTAAFPAEDPERLRQIVGVPGFAKKVKPESDPRVESFMKKNGIKDKDEAIKILKDAGKL